MSVAIREPFPVPRGLAIALAAAGPVAAGGILAVRAHLSRVLIATLGLTARAARDLNRRSVRRASRIVPLAVGPITGELAFIARPR